MLEPVSGGDPTKHCMASVRNFRIFPHPWQLPWHPLSLLNGSFWVDLCSLWIKDLRRQQLPPWDLPQSPRFPDLQTYRKSAKPSPEVSTKARMLRMQELASYWCECLPLSTYLPRDSLFRILLEFYLLGQNLQSGFSLARALNASF